MRASIATARSGAGAPNDADYVSAMLNVLKDSQDEKRILSNTETAVLNILEDFTEERARVQATHSALVNILEDFEAENHKAWRSTDALKRANEVAQLANEELEAFSYSVAHDLRAPLRGMDGFSLALIEDYGDLLPPEGKAYLNHIRDSAQLMGRLIDDLLSLSRISRSKLQRADVNLSDTARATVGRLRNEEPGRQIEIEIEPDMVAFADPSLIAIAFENLIGNAWKFSAHVANARIHCGRTTDHSGRPVYFVEDNGAGFDMDYSEKLFKPLQRLHKVSEFEGTGIGLATVHRIITRHGGRIWAESKVGGGATFYFMLGESR